MIRLNKSKLKLSNWLGFESPSGTIKWILGLNKEIMEYDYRKERYVDKIVDCNTNLLKLLFSPFKLLLFLVMSTIFLGVVLIGIPFTVLSAIEIGNINEEDVDSA